MKSLDNVEEIDLEIDEHFANRIKIECLWIKSERSIPRSIRDRDKIFPFL